MECENCHKMFIAPIRECPHCKSEKNSEILEKTTQSEKRSKQRFLIIVVFVILALCKGLLLYMIFYMNEEDMTAKLVDVLGYRWDSKHFVNIAENGYPSGVENDILYAFAPFYPFLIGALNPIFQDYLITGIVISNVCYFASIYAFYKFCLLHADKLTSCLITLAFGLFPSYMVYGTVAYSESIYLLFSILSFYYLKKDRYVPSSIFLSFAILTRYIGGFLLPIYLLIGTYRKWKMDRKLIEWRLLWLLIPTISYIMLFTYFYTKTGNFFVIISSHVYFADSLQNPYQQFRWFFEGFFVQINPHVNPLLLMIERYMFVLPFLVLVLLNFRDDKELGLYGTVLMIITMSTVGISSIASPRIMISAWVAFLALRERISKDFYILIYILFFMLSLWMMFKYATGFYA